MPAFNIVVGADRLAKPTMGAGTFQKVVRLGLKNQRRRREDRGAKGAEEGEVWGVGAPLPIRLGGLVECRELPQRSLGEVPAANAFLHTGTLGPENAAGGDKKFGKLLLLGLKCGTTFYIESDLFNFRKMSDNILKTVRDSLIVSTKFE